MNLIKVIEIIMMIWSNNNKNNRNQNNSNSNQDNINKKMRWLNPQMIRDIEDYYKWMLIKIKQTIKCHNKS